MATTRIDMCGCRSRGDFIDRLQPIVTADLRWAETLLICDGDLSVDEIDARLETRRREWALALDTLAADVERELKGSGADSGEEHTP